MLFLIVLTSFIVILLIGFGDLFTIACHKSHPMVLSSENKTLKNLVFAAP